MDEKLVDEKLVDAQIAELNQLYKEQDDIYHVLAVRCGLSDASFWVMYALCEDDREYSQQDLCNAWFFPKQTINSAIHSLTKMGYITLRRAESARNKKYVDRTEEGMIFCRQKIYPVIEAEHKAFLAFDEEERSVFLRLFQKQNQCLKREMELDKNED